MKKNSTRLLLAIPFLVVVNLPAQYSLDWYAVGGGGGTIGDGAYTLGGTVGQLDPGNLAGNGYVIEGGFWTGAVAPPLLSIVRTGAEAALSWTGSGFSVQSADDPRGPWADGTTGASSDGIRYQANVPIIGRMKFFRLRAIE